MRRNQIERPQRVLVQVGRLTLDHLDRHDAERPDVDLCRLILVSLAGGSLCVIVTAYLWSVLLPVDDFRGHPVRRAHHRGSFRLLGGDLRAEAKVGQLDAAVQPKQDVVTLDVPMDDLVAVEELQRLQHLATNRGDLALVHAGLGNDVGERTSRQVLHDDPQLLGHQIAVQVVDHVRMFVLSHHQDLVDDQFLLRLLAEVHLLDGDLHAGGTLDRRVHRAGRTLADLLHPIVLPLGIAHADDRSQPFENLFVGDFLLLGVGPLLVRGLIGGGCRGRRRRPNGRHDRRRLRRARWYRCW